MKWLETYRAAYRAKKIALDGLVNVDRFEVIDHTGRAYLISGNLYLEIVAQDDGATIKVFVKDIPE